MIDDENGMVTKAIDGANKDMILFRLSKAVGADIAPLFQFWGVYADNPAALAKKIAAENIFPSMKIYSTLKKYQSLIPTDQKAFQSFATQWWGDKEEVAKAKYSAIWDTYDERYAAMIHSNVQDIIEHYFAEGPPEVVGAHDTEAPTPNPMNFSIPPMASGERSVAMIATTASDAAWVQYYFTNTSGNGHDSGWQSARSYEDTGLSPDTRYTYTIKTRDYSTAQNMSKASAPASATTKPKDTSKPKPDRMSMKVAPKATSPSTIYMAANVASDVSGVEYYFKCITTGGHDSGWQEDISYTDINLTPNTSYSYTVVVRDKSPQHNSTKVSTESSGTTLEEVSSAYLVMSKPEYASGEDIVIHFIEPSGKEWGWIGIFNKISTESASPNDGMQYQYFEANSKEDETSGSMTFTGLGAGNYQARLHFGDDYPISARIEFTIE